MNTKISVVFSVVAAGPLVAAHQALAWGGASAASAAVVANNKE